MTTPATAWPLENAVFSAAMLAHRLPWADAPARALGLDSLTREGAARKVLAHLRHSRCGRPVRLRTPFGSFLVPLGADDTAGLLAEGAASDALAPAVRLDGAGRRHGLHPHAPLPPDAAPSAALLRGPLAEELEKVVAARRDDHVLPWEAWRPGLLRAARRVVVGEAAADDTLLTEVLFRTAGAAGGHAYEGRAAALNRRLAPYLSDPDPRSVAAGLDRGLNRNQAAGPVVPTARAQGAPHSAASRPGEALAHTLAVVSEAAVTTALQALALAAAGVPGAADGPAGAVALALDHFPPVEAAVHPVRTRFVWDGLAVDAGTEILAAPGWLRDAAAPADAVAREGSGEGRGAFRYDGPSPLCGSATGCSVTAFAVEVAEEIVRFFTEAARPALLSPALRPDRMPFTLPPHTVRIALLGAGAGAGVGAGVGLGAVPPAVRVGSPASSAALARADADRLDRHARSLVACAAETGWNGDEAGERFRMQLLEHAERCTRAASDVRAAARRLGD
ncbi:hypothetical protein [Streptomyces sp. A0592]|uniref:hypothetical protein n=1 Tax=Streptomyces sp. A0592 TaxID=2563099 RepID=UPI00109EA51C|nr:hypothetical protein [Streptomyces sp. A0592]THA86261.1 hypothetical protein E6U81_04540 [Streptomyces sp. A0592]